MASSREQRKAPALWLAVALLLVGAGGVIAGPQASDEVVTGHTTYLNASTNFDNCFAGIAGALFQRVTWFNGATLFSRMAEGDGGTYIYAMEHFQEEDDPTGVDRFDPSEEILYETGNEWVMDDENRQDVTWTVTEYYALKDNGKQVGANADPPDPGTSGGGEIGYNVEDGQYKVYIYVVAVGPVIEDQQIHRDYNFVTVVDTCKFLHQGNGKLEHDNGNTGDDPDTTADDHDPNDVPQGESGGSHNHTAFNVDIFVGGEPESIPLPTDPNPNSNETKADGES